MLITLLTLAAFTPGPRPVVPTAAMHVAAMSDADILGMLAQVDVSEIETARLVTSKTNSAAVRAYAQMLIADHQKSMGEGTALAKKLGVTPTQNPDTAMAREHAAEMVKMQQMSPNDLDKEFVSHEQEDHSKVIDKVTNTLLPAAQNAELKTQLRNELPVLRKHEQRAEALKSTVK